MNTGVPPVESAAVAYAAIDHALDLDHTPHPAAWHRISRRMWVTACESCGMEIWVSGPAGGWRYGGAATREVCEGDVLPDPPPFSGGAA